MQPGIVPRTSVRAPAVRKLRHELKFVAPRLGQTIPIGRKNCSSFRRPAADNEDVSDSIWGLRDRDLLVLVVLALILLGVLMVQSAAMNLDGSIESIEALAWSSRGKRHALFAALSVLTFVTATRLRYRNFSGKLIFGALLLAAGMCLFVLTPLGTVVNGSRRWIVLGPLRLQPSEVAKWCVILFLAWRLSRPSAGDLIRGFIPNCILVGGTCLLIVIEDFGTAALIGCSAFAMMLAGPTRLWHLLVTLPPALGGAFAFVYMEPYRWRRMTAFLDPWAASETDGYHMIQSLYSFASGGLFGTGLGNGVQKLGYLPEDTTDFIFAVICEELGIFGAGLVIGLYLVLLWIGWRASRRATTPMGQMLAFGITATIGLQACINIAVATASVPTKGMPLPLISAGGSGLIMTGFMLGLLYGICREGNQAQEAMATDDEFEEGSLALE